MNHVDTINFIVVGIQSCGSYQGCPMCLHSWTAGSTLQQTKCVYDGYRRFLAVGSRARQNTFRFRGHVYEYGCVCTYLLIMTYIVTSIHLLLYNLNQHCRDTYGATSAWQWTCRNCLRVCKTYKTTFLGAQVRSARSFVARIWFPSLRSGRSFSRFIHIILFVQPPPSPPMYYSYPTLHTQIPRLPARW
jgi:hypothetical protein